MSMRLILIGSRSGESIRRLMRVCLLRSGIMSNINEIEWECQQYVSILSKNKPGDRILHMAKKKGPRQIFGLKCSVCNSFNYITERNKTNTPDKLEIKKYCKVCKVHRIHKESKKLK